jgi:succinoglycan biosynthesis protein ExoO
VNVLVVTDHLPGHDLGFQKSGHAQYLGSILDHFIARGDDVTVLVFRPQVDFAARPLKGLAYRVAGPSFVTAGPFLIVRSAGALRRLVAWSVFAKLPQRVQAGIDGIRRRIRHARGAVHHLGSFIAPDEVAYVRAHVARSAPGLVVYDGIFNSCGKLDDVETCLIAHEVKHERTSSFAEGGIDVVASAVSATDEAAVLADVDSILAIQWDDARALRSLAPQARVVVVPATVTVPERSGAAAPAFGRCLFVGSGSFHNYDGITWFIETCWPRIRAAVPAATLDIYGSVCVRLGGPPAGVTLHGIVDDLAAAYASAAVTIVPLRIGSGLKVKLIEAFAHAQAVVTTPVGAQGLTAFSPRPFVLAQAGPAFADSVIALLGAPDRQRALRADALACAAAFTPAAAFAEFDALLDGEPVAAAEVLV